MTRVAQKCWCDFSSRDSKACADTILLLWPNGTASFPAIKNAQEHNDLTQFWSMFKTSMMTPNKGNQLIPIKQELPDPVGRSAKLAGQANVSVCPGKRN
jgi:hypothetical protein